MSGRARVIVVGNEKGGSGKSTVAMHLIVSLLGMGARVASLDLDSRQATLTRYLENRRQKIGRGDGRTLPMPAHDTVPPAGGEDRFRAALDGLRAASDIVVVDTPGYDATLSRLAHAEADLLITPLNDSFIDLDVLARVDPESMRISRPSHYAEMVWDARKKRAQRGEHAADWFVLRNRLSSLDARNKRQMEALLDSLSKRIGFRLAGGLGERVIYRELFLSGLTLLDFGEGSGLTMQMAHIAARQELRRLVEELGLPALVAGATGAPMAEPAGFALPQGHSLVG